MLSLSLSLRCAIPLVLATLLCGPVRADEPATGPIYLIGNSLTNDTAPSKLDGDVQWHIDCGKSLGYILAHPEEPCVKTSTLWPDALKAKQYALLSVQPHYDDSVESAAAAIGTWLEMQPGATFIIHTGWGHHAKRVQERDTTKLAGRFVHSPAQYQALMDLLHKRYPDRSFRSTHAMSLLEQVASDAEAGKAPFASVAEIHRDAIHVTLGPGRYLMHNCMRHALGQPRSDVGFESVPPDVKAYLNGVLDTLPPID